MRLNPKKARVLSVELGLFSYPMITWLEREFLPEVPVAQIASSARLMKKVKQSAPSRIGSLGTAATRIFRLLLTNIAPTGGKKVKRKLNQPVKLDKNN
jgi:hypothetical protein